MKLEKVTNVTNTTSSNFDQKKFDGIPNEQSNTPMTETTKSKLSVESTSETVKTSSRITKINETTTLESSRTKVEVKEQIEKKSESSLINLPFTEGNKSTKTKVQVNKIQSKVSSESIKIAQRKTGKTQISSCSGKKTEKDGISTYKKDQEKEINQNPPISKIHNEEKICKKTDDRVSKKVHCMTDKKLQAQ